MQFNKNQQLGMPFGTASQRLKKTLLYFLAVRLDLHWCFQCGKEIQTCEELSVEHKIPWLDSENPRDLFFNLDNIAFSHLICNISARRKTNKKYFTEKERKEAERKSNTEYKRRTYSPESRHKKWEETGQ